MQYIIEAAEPAFTTTKSSRLKYDCNWKIQLVLRGGDGSYRRSSAGVYSLETGPDGNTDLHGFPFLDKGPRTGKRKSKECSRGQDMGHANENVELVWVPSHC